jgi:hypothetical protein
MLVWDIEANGLLDQDGDKLEADKIWCLSAKNIQSSKRVTLYNTSLTRDNILDLLCNSGSIIGHNIIRYDLPMIKKFFDIDIVQEIGREAIIDTFLWSKVSWPDRPMPLGCPTTIRNPITKKGHRIGPHGLESWGYRVGFKKLAIHDWRVFSDDMLDRCNTDVEINHLTFLELLKEMDLDILDYEVQR